MTTLPGRETLPGALPDTFAPFSPQPPLGDTRAPISPATTVGERPASPVASSVVPPAVSQVAPAAATSLDAGTAPVRLGVIDYLNVVPVYDWLLRRERIMGARHGADDGAGKAAGEAAGEASPAPTPSPATVGATPASPVVALALPEATPAHAPGIRPSIQTVAGVPAQMNAALLAGEIDISNVSSVAFGEHARDWLLIPRLSVAAHGKVESVLLFSWHADWLALDGGSLALSDHSATSVALVKLLAEQRYGAHPRYVAQPPDLDAMLAAHDAALLIGDIALVEGQARREVAGRGRPYVFDLAAEWQAWTGLPFVFAVWAARADRAEAIRASGAVALLRASKAKGLADLERLAREASVRLSLPEDVCLRYLRLLDYDLSAHDLAGLRRFLELAVPGFDWSHVRVLEE